MAEVVADVAAAGQSAPSSGSLPQRKPEWLRVKLGTAQLLAPTRRTLRELGLNTVCEEAACPNLGECWQQGHATVMILGEVCTRACAFCNVATGRPRAPDPLEPARVARMAERLDLRHVVITSVDRDDLADGGASHFVDCVDRLRERCPDTTVELLVPDFLRKPGAGERVLRSQPDVFNHNLETVPRLYSSARQGADYRVSLELLALAARAEPALFTKSGLMVGLGETRDELLTVMDDLREAGVDFLTIGQYLQPTRRHLPVQRYLPPEEFEQLAEQARARGFTMVASSPLTRSSYHAGEDFARLRALRADAN